MHPAKAKGPLYKTAGLLKWSWGD